MWAGQQRYRTVILSKAAAAFVDEHRNEHRFGEMWGDGEGIEWVLARNPEIGVARPPTEGEPNYRMYSVAADPLANTRPFLVLYTWDENEVGIEGITFTDALPTPTLS